MPTADSSQTARITRIKSQKLAAFREANPTVREQGPGGQTTDYTTTYLWSRLGSKPFYGVGANGLETDAGCCGTGGGPTTFRFTTCGKHSRPNVTAGTGYTITNNTGATIKIVWYDSDSDPISTLDLNLPNGETWVYTAPTGAVQVDYECLI